MSDTTSVTKAAGIVGAASLLSRLLGFVRDMALAWYFGAGFGSDAFFTAFRIPEISRRLFVEGALTGVFIPKFSRCLMTQGEDAAFDLARCVLKRLTVFLVILSLVGVLLAPQMVRLLAPGFYLLPPKFSLTVRLTRIMLPYVMCVGVVALFMGVLNVLGHFAAPALAPALLNLTIIAAIFLFASNPPLSMDPVLGIAMGVVIGGILQLALQVPFLIKKRFYFWRRTRAPSGEFRKMGLLTVPSIFGSAIYQINMVVIVLLASLLPEGSVTVLYFADRLVQFPVGIFAVALATAIFPSLSRQAAAKDSTAVRESFVRAVQMVLFIATPAMVGLIVLREPIVVLLFQRGEFNAVAAQATARALLYFGMGIWAYSIVKLVVFTFYALQDTWTPVKAAVLTLGANLFLGLLLMKPMGYGGLALSFSLSSMLGLGWLFWALGKKVGSLGWRTLLGSARRSLIGAAVMGGGVRLVWPMAIPAQNGGVFHSSIALAGTIGAGLFLYGAYSFLIKSPELENVLALVRKGIGGQT